MALKKLSVSTTNKKIKLVEFKPTMSREKMLKNLLESLKSQGFRITGESKNK